MATDLANVTSPSTTPDALFGIDNGQIVRVPIGTSTSLVTVGRNVPLTAAEIASPTAAILADTSATYIGPAPDFFRYYSNTISLNQFGAGGATMAFVTRSLDITRPADTTAYAANDCLSDSTSAPTVGGFTFTGVVNATGKSGLITDLLVVSSNPAGLLTGEIWLFDTAVTAINDNAAFTLSDAEAKTLIGVIPFSTVADAQNSQSNPQNLNIGFTTVGSSNLRFLVKVLFAYTPISAEVLTLRMKVVQVD